MAAESASHGHFWEFVDFVDLVQSVRLPVIRGCILVRGARCPVLVLREVVEEHKVLDLTATKHSFSE